jgi:hypothetical protein
MDDRFGNGLADVVREPTRPEVLRSALRLVDDGRQRLRSGNANIDPFNIDDIRAAYCPTDGDPRRGNVDREIDFNWKRYETYGKPDYAEMRTYHDQGWRQANHDDFPERFAPAGTEGPVLVKDMILMWRPMRLTVQARSEEYEAATRAMRVNRQRIADTPEGSAPRVVLTDRTTREAIEIPIPE